MTRPCSEPILNHEYQVLVKDYNFTQPELERISLNAIHASFLSPTRKTEAGAGIPGRVQKIIGELVVSKK